ncbi:MAG: hypothetical protein HXY34_06545 [Candidatus Thorarchaeota archaeon]|nr:hypothetical protein [Candidatus Thorarchaeota archaeon]
MNRDAVGGTREQDLEAIISRLQRFNHEIVLLRNISRLFAEMERPIESTLYTLVHMIPEAMRFPTLASARVKLARDEYASANFQQTQWSTTTPLTTPEGVVGELEVNYTELPPQVSSDEVFLPEERSLVSAIGVEVSLYLERKENERVRQQLQREIELYSSILKHDLRNDLGLVVSSIDLARMMHGEESPQLDDLLSTAQAVCQRMTSLLNVFAPQEQEVVRDIVALVEQATRAEAQAHPKLKITLDKSAVTGPLVVPASRLLPSVFENLLRNASKYAGQEAHVNVRIRRLDNRVEITVSDNGPGIPQDVLPRLFQRGASSSGSGLGLYLSREVVKSLNGTIELAESEMGGATFRVLLPLSL